MTGETEPERIDVMNEQLYTVKEIADHFRVTRQAVYKWINEGRLQALKVGEHMRITRTAINAFVAPADPADIKLEGED